MARRKQNLVNDILDTAGAWLGGNRGTVNPQVQRVQRDLGKVAQTVDTYGFGGLGQAALRDIENFKQGGSLPTNLAKTAAVNLAAGAVGAKAAQVAGRAVAKTGVPARVANKLTGKTVLVHGTGNKLEGTALRPVGGSPGAPNEKVVFGWNPRYKGAKDTIPINVQEYAAKTWNMGNVPEYNVVIGKAPSRAVTKVEGNPAILKSTEPAKIEAVVKANVDYETYVNNLNKALKKAGAPLRGDSRFGPMGDRVERIRRQMQYRRNNRNSTA